MRKSRVEKVISYKINKWLSSIKDEKLKDELKDNIIVTGGCIVSLINNETPNDFDVYFRTKNIAKRVAQYYCDVFNDRINQKNDMGKHVNAYVLDGEDVKKSLESAEVSSDGYYYVRNLAGHAPDIAVPYVKIKNTPPERIKVIVNSKWGIISENSEQNNSTLDEENITQYVNNNTTPVTCTEDDDVEKLDDALNTSVNDYLESLDTADEINGDDIENLNTNKDDFRPVFMSTNAITLSNKIQLIIRFYGEPEEIHDTFDYIHCMCYWTSWGKKVEYTVDALDAIINKELRYVGSKYPICSVLRMRKFLSRGWTINAGQILKMAFQISELDLTDINILEDQLVGVDSIYFASAIATLRAIADKKESNNEEFTYDSTYLATIVDKIFK